jgi:hypothetical protein
MVESYCHFSQWDSFLSAGGNLQQYVPIGVILGYLRVPHKRSALAWREWARRHNALGELAEEFAPGQTSMNSQTIGQESR